MLRSEASFIPPSPTTSPHLPDDSGVWRGPLTARYADGFGEKPDKELLAGAIQESNTNDVDELVEKLRAANRAWFQSTVQDVPLSFSRNENGVSTQDVSVDRLSERTARRARASDLLSLALKIRRDDDQHPAVFGTKRK